VASLVPQALGEEGGEARGGVGEACWMVMQVVPSRFGDWSAPPEVASATGRENSVFNGSSPMRCVVAMQKTRTRIASAAVPTSPPP
jgi:hypothetical protein